MKQTEKLDSLIKKILKEELNKSQKGLLDVIIPKKFAFALMDPRVSDDPSYVSFMKSNDGGTTYNLKIQSKTPEFRELKRAMGRIDNGINIGTPELEKIYNDIMSGIEKADIEGSVDLIKQGRKSGLEELGSIQELSPALMNRAAKKADAKIDPLVYGNPSEKEKKQANTLDSHINPEVKKEVDRVKEIIGAQEMKFTSFNAFRNGILEISFGKGKDIFLRVTNNSEVAPSNKKYKLMGVSNMKMEDLPKENKKAIEELVLYIAEKQVVSEIEKRQSGLEELEEADTAFISYKDPKKAQKRKAAVTAGVSVIEDDPTDPSSEKLKPVGEAEEVLENEVKASDIAGQVSEIVDKLKTMAEAKEDPRKQKLAIKAVKQMESAKAALEALTAHETMLEEKDQAEQEKKAEKHKKNIEKIFKGIVKDENIVNRLKEKLSAKDIAALTKKLSDKGKELDEEKLARIVLNRSLQEGWTK